MAYSRTFDPFDPSHLSNAAYHEAGHAVATVLAHRLVQSPMPRTSQPISHVEIFQDDEGFSGGIYATTVYSPDWNWPEPEYRFDPVWCDAMEWEIVISLAGGIAEVIHRGEADYRREVYFMAFTNHWGLKGSCGDDLKKVGKVLADLRKVKRRPARKQRFVERTLALLLEHWSAVEALAAALIERKRIEGDEVERIISTVAQVE